MREKYCCSYGGRSRTSGPKQIGYPIIIRPSERSAEVEGVVENESDLLPKSAGVFECSPNHELLLEESLSGWKEIELEVMRDKADNAVIICSIENLDPMGLHTGDSITVAPVQTLTDKSIRRSETLRCDS